ncbi:hypothetical protein RPMA_10330 [Tardiphaga alba]|uniref:Uncharacterized protein n=1 Tax=Tardiphaga alba TaxID=340268 RepID=A0ABX8A9X9_9BRAD|nr:hypothetical protein RPMA_10330 [Tardiphaga alba]
MPQLDEVCTATSESRHCEEPLRRSNPVFACCLLDCRVASLLAMTAETSAPCRAPSQARRDRSRRRPWWRSATSACRAGA